MAAVWLLFAGLFLLVCSFAMNLVKLSRLHRARAQASNRSRLGEIMEPSEDEDVPASLPANLRRGDLASWLLVAGLLLMAIAGVWAELQLR